MASLHFLIAIAIVAIVVSPALATEYVVGDGKGWTLNFDQSWAEGKQFNVGDKLIFNYPQGAHNVYRVNGTSFQQCVPPAGVEALTTGNDVITLTTPGRKWYICGVGKHCESGNMKLAITVMPQLESPAASPSSGGARPSSAATGVAISKYHAGMIGLFSILVRIIMV